MGGNSKENNERKRCSLSRPRYHIVGALACHVRLRFVRTSEILGDEAASPTAAIGDLFSPLTVDKSRCGLAS